MITKYITYLACVKRYSPNTILAYEKDVRAFARWARENLYEPRWSTITREDMDKYVIYMVYHEKSPATVNRHISSIKSFYNYLIREGLMTKNPLRWMSYNKLPETIPNTIPEGDLEVCYHHSQGTVGLMIRLLYTTGVRIQELLDIEKTDIDADKLRIRIHGKGQRDRYVFTCPDVMDELVEYCEGRYGQPFAGIDQFAVRRAIYFELKKYSNAKQLSPHAIRHTFATKAAAQGCNATTLQVMLGHKQLKTTQKYIDLGRHDVQQAFQTYATVH